MYYDAIQVGQRIKEARRHLGLSQEVFSERLGISRNHLARIEIGLRCPSIDTLIAISLASGYTLDYLVLGRR